MPCRYCGEREPLKLSIRTRFIDGRVETIEICLNCYWLDRFRCEGENGRLSDELFERAESREIFERFKRSSAGMGEPVC